VLIHKDLFPSSGLVGALAPTFPGCYVNPNPSLGKVKSQRDLVRAAPSTPPAIILRRPLDAWCWILDSDEQVHQLQPPRPFRSLTRVDLTKAPITPRTSTRAAASIVNLEAALNRHYLSLSNGSFQNTQPPPLATMSWEPNQQSLATLAGCLRDSLSGFDKNAQKAAEIVSCAVLDSRLRSRRD
jgi:hypothetical protein